MSVLVVTSVGDIVVDLHTDRCPLTAKNFLKLCKMKYYNGCLFHKVEKDFVAQTGDRTGTGNGGDSLYKFLYGDQARFFDDEIHSDLKHSKIGTVAMSSAGKNCNASQFYFTLHDELDYLDGKHAVFGAVEEQEGLETLIKINEAFVDDKGRPLKNIRIKHTYILDDPFSDPVQLEEFIPEKSPEGKPDDEITEERLEDNWVPLEDTVGTAELEEILRAKEAHTNAAILESIGDIPDADIKPPENVLFVCKLNPVTQDEDLHTIFSRFGNVISADIIRDYKTGDSLCYAFIEFEIQEACELAYIKMDNTLIDDRRIHVDFSQSVSKLWTQYRHGKRSQNKDGGCFKCGSTNHIAKNCDQESGGKSEASKYSLKEGNAQYGGGCQSYEMVFDEGDMQRMEGNGNETKTKQKRLKVDDLGYEDSKQRSHSHDGGTDSRKYKHRTDYADRAHRPDVAWKSSRMNEEHQNDRDRESKGRMPERCEKDRSYRGSDAELHTSERRSQQSDRPSTADQRYRQKHRDQDTQKKDRRTDVGLYRDREDHRIAQHRSNEENGKTRYHDSKVSKEYSTDKRRVIEKSDKYGSRSGRHDKEYGRSDERGEGHGHLERRQREEKRR